MGCKRNGDYIYKILLRLHIVFCSPTNNINNKVRISHSTVTDKYYSTREEVQKLLYKSSCLPRRLKLCDDVRLNGYRYSLSRDSWIYLLARNRRVLVTRRISSKLDNYYQPCIIALNAPFLSLPSCLH